MTSRRARWPVAALAVILLAGGGGCYSRVVDVKGPGASHYPGTIYEPNYDGDPIFGPPEKKAVQK